MGNIARMTATINMLNTKLTANLAIFVVGVPVMADRTNKFKPRGGVMKPNPSAVSIKMEKWIGSIPIVVASGNIKGPRMTILGVASIKHPATTKTRSITAIMKAGSDEIDVN